MKRLSTPVTAFALAALAIALLASYPVLSSFGRTAPASGDGSSWVPAGGLAIAVGATTWAGALIWTARARRRRQAGGQRLNDLVGRLHVATILTDSRGAITAMNGAAESLTGWGKAAALGLPIRAVFTLVDRRTRRPVVNPVVRALYKDIVVGPSHDTLLLTKRGEERRIRDTATPIHDRRGRLIGCALVGLDRDEPGIAADMFRLTRPTDVTAIAA
jgi:PAS domain S-box-containing protein